MQREIEPLTEAVKAAPPVAVLGSSLLGFSLSEWAVLGSIVLIGLQIFFLLRKELYLPWKAKRNGQ